MYQTKENEFEVDFSNTVNRNKKTFGQLMASVFQSLTRNWYSVWSENPLIQVVSIKVPFYQILLLVCVWWNDEMAVNYTEQIHETFISVCEIANQHLQTDRLVLSCNKKFFILTHFSVTDLSLLENRETVKARTRWDHQDLPRNSNCNLTIPPPRNLLCYYYGLR